MTELVTVDEMDVRLATAAALKVLVVPRGSQEVFIAAGKARQVVPGLETRVRFVDDPIEAAAYMFPGFEASLPETYQATMTAGGEDKGQSEIIISEEGSD
jgi:hypothetical protein